MRTKFYMMVNKHVFIFQELCEKWQWMEKSKNVKRKKIQEQYWKILKLDGLEPENWMIKGGTMINEISTVTLSSKFLKRKDVPISHIFTLNLSW